VKDASDLVVLARVSGSLLVVLLVAVLAARLARRAGRRAGRGAMAVRERIGLTRDTSAVVLEVGDRLLLLGVSPHQVTVLAELGPSGALVAGSPLPIGAAQGAPAIGTAEGALPITSGIPAQREAVRVVSGVPPAQPLTRRDLRAAGVRRRAAVPPVQRGTGSAIDPRTWQQGLEALRDLTARRG
jgi:flagellar protein FliO/FliZ